MIATCCVTGLIAGDSDACGDCDPCILGAHKVPEAVKKLLKEKDEWRAKYAEAMGKIEELELAADLRENRTHDRQSGGSRIDDYLDARN